MYTEMTGNNATPQVAGWIGYDGECAFCLRWVRRVERPLRRHGFDFVPLQTRWERRCLAGESRSGADTRQRDAGVPGNVPAPVFTEMILELPDGRELGGADAAVVLMRFIWWLWPLWLLSRLPGMMPVFQAVYRHIAAKRHCASGNCSVRSSRRQEAHTEPIKLQPTHRTHRTTAFFELP